MKKRREFIKKSVMGTAGLAFAGLGFPSHSFSPIGIANSHINVPTIGSLDQKQNEKPVSEFAKIKKIDVHMHITSDADYLREVMDYFNLKMLVMCNEGLKLDRLKLQVDVAIDISKRYPRYYAWQTTFGFEGMDKPDYANRVIEYIKYGFDNGALGVKVWKEIGMQLKNTKGEFVQIDDPIFDPILNYIAKEGKTLFTHIGDPVSNWLSVGPDGTQNRWYKEGAGIASNRIGEFKGEVPFDKLILAHDHMLSKHPDLKVVGCHMGSTEFDVDVASRRLDKFPNLAFETSAVLSYLMGQAREKVRAFFIKYQDRILYALDKSGGLVATNFFVDMSKVNMRWTPEEVVEEKKKLIQNYNNDFEYYITANEINRGSYSIRGLGLPEEVLQKFFYTNAVKWVPGVNKAF